MNHVPDAARLSREVEPPAVSWEVAKYEQGRRRPYVLERCERCHEARELLEVARADQPCARIELVEVTRRVVS